VSKHNSAIAIPLSALAESFTTSDESQANGPHQPVLHGRILVFLKRPQ
jgi:hypothetical protein